MDGVKYSVAPDENTAMTDLLAGRFHRYFPVLPDNIGRVEKETGGRAKVSTPLAANRGVLFFNGTKKPFNDPRVRQAVSLVLDRQELIQISELGNAAQGGYLQPGGTWAISDDQRKKVPGYDKTDIAEAKKLLASAGVTEPQSGTLLNRSDPTFQAGGIWVQGTLKKVLGWDYKLDVKDSASASAAAAATQFDLCHWRYGLTFDDPDATFGQLLTSKAASNWSRIGDAEADALFEKQSQTLDAAQRKQLVQQLELKYLNNFPHLTLYFPKLAHALWNVVQNYHLTGAIFVNQRYQDVWLSKS
jgi:peptide/nickel transport system substrate-binding protein